MYANVHAYLEYTRCFLVYIYLIPWNDQVVSCDRNIPLGHRYIQPKLMHIPPLPTHLEVNKNDPPEMHRHCYHKTSPLDAKQRRKHQRNHACAQESR